MSAVPILGAFALAGAIVAWVSWHRRTFERHSVEHHQHALETLRHVADRAEHPAHPRSSGAAQEKPNSASGPSALRARSPGRLRTAAPPRPPVAASNGAASPARKVSTPPTAGTTGHRRRPASGRTPSAAHPTMVFVDDAAPPLAAHGAGLGPGTASVAGVAPSGFVARLVGTRRARRRTAAASGAAVVVVGAVLGVTLASGTSPSRPHTTPSTAGGGGAGHASSGGHRTGNGRHPSTPKNAGHTDGSSPDTPTTAKPATPASLTPSAAQSHSASYVAPASPYTVSVSASGQCWVLAQEVGSGQVLWTGTLQAGNLRSFSGFGAVQLRLGAASDVTVSLNGTELALPAGFQSPFDVNLAA